MKVDVIIDLNNVMLNRPYSYNMSDELSDHIAVGMRVLVNFNYRDYLAFVVKIEEGFDENLKTVEKIVDLENYLNHELVSMAVYHANQTAQNYIQVLNMMLPSSLRSKYQPYLKIENKNNLSKELLDIFNKDGKFYYKYLDKSIKELSKAIRKKDISVNYDITSTNKSLLKKHLIINEYTYKNPKQKELLDLINSGFCLERELNKSGYGSSIKTLLKNGVLSVELKEVLVQEIYESLDKEITLNLDQENAYREIEKTYDTFQVTLLHGVTGSGKTEVYLKTAEDVVKSGKTVLFLVPEITLTHQMIKRFYAKFKKISIIHSKISDNLKYLEFQKIRKNEVDVVIGVRSAIFAPINNLGLIIVDEAHSDNYFQDQTPSYSAKDMALFRAKYHDIPIVLGSATPDVFDYSLGRTKMYNLVNLPSKALNTIPQSVEIIDMTNEEDKLLSKRASELIQETLEKNEQVIILHNRLGYSPYLICPKCKSVKKCDHCDISLTYFKKDNQLKCRYCGRVYPLQICECGNPYEFITTGTEFLEEELSKRFNQKVLRLDRASAKSNNDVKEIIDSFEKKEANILIGTTMVSKGLDFGDCSLVIVLNADYDLNYPSFNSSEKAYQLFTQVAGRAGRRDIKSFFLIQTMMPNHFVFSCLNDYNKFYKNEIKLRKMANYPPFKRICLIEMRSKYEKSLNEFSLLAYDHLQNHLKKSTVIGPSIPYVKVINDSFIRQIIVKYNEDDLYQVIMQIKNNKIKGVSIKVLFDPVFI